MKKLDNKQVFMKDGIFHILHKDKYESRETFIERGFYILDEIKKTYPNFDYNKIILQSKLLNK